ncbi:hypothetical protein [Frigoriglobus tundricola]|uniref:Uncharacterized protein n=1 Tax=Frigoriglobus tundricola TaxID=2774151 RepID=A0A6M5YTP6_9BACT|nr:hypothetical protein [Frigoriglobus tundricola]QJW96292.1 hypothetical protein FTUN_3849 [Frigoriglobus tundricola]
MTPETEVIACPACKHLVRVPLDWLGTQVQCPECKALFRAPVRADGKLTEPELVAGPAPAAARPARPDAMLLLPAFGLLLCGIAGTIVNGVLAYQFVTDPAGATGWARNQVPALRQAGFGTPGTPEEQAAEDERNAAQLAGTYRWLTPVSFVVSVVVFAGGAAMARRRNYRLAQVACALAAVNVAHACCVPGALAGLWGLLMLNSDEGREHFQK